MSDDPYDAIVAYINLVVERYHETNDILTRMVDLIRKLDARVKELESRSPES